MKGIVFVSKYNAELCEMSDRLPEENEVRIALKYSAVSAGTERALITANEDGDETCKFGFPSYSGYSGSGIITHVGKNVKSLNRAIELWFMVQVINNFRRSIKRKL